MTRARYILTLLALVLTGSALGAQPETPDRPPRADTREHSGTNWLRGAVEERLAGREPLFYLSPGVSNNVIDLSFNERNGQETTLTEPITPSFAFDIAFSQFQISESFGLGFLLHTTVFHLKRQHVEGGEENQLHDRLVVISEGEEALEGPGRDLGSRVRGYSTMAIPFLYYGREGQENYRVGAGIGVGRTEFSGTVVTDDQSSRYLLIDSLQNPSRVKGLSRYHLFTNSLVDIRSLDPATLYLFWDIDRPGRLEQLGLYWLATGRVAPRAADFAYMRFFNRDLNEPELLALRGFSNGVIAVNAPVAPAFMLFAESPAFLGGFKFRLAVEGLFFERGQYTVNLSVASLALYYPIPVSLPAD